MDLINLTGQLSDYTEVDALHRRIHSEVSQGKRPDTAIMIEYQPTFTAGKRTQPEHIPNSDVPIIKVDRGGSVTWHGPGQLVCYPIIKLPEPLDVIAYIRRLETVVIDLLASYQIHATRIEGRSGAWILKQNPGEQDRKICAMGVRTAAATTMHGLALNVCPDMTDFGRIIPCGLADAGVVSMANLGVSAQVPDLVEPLFQLLEQRYHDHRFHHLAQEVTAHPVTVADTVTKNTATGSQSELSRPTNHPNNPHIDHSASFPSSPVTIER